MSEIPTGGAASKLSPTSRFLAQTTKTESCWLWAGPCDSSGYGAFKVDGRSVGVHRWAYEHFVGPVPEGMELDHLCRMRNCVNPDHLEPVTHAENMRRAPWTAMVKNRTATHCPQGHEYSPDNTYQWRGGRYCRACNREAVARYQARRRARASGGDGQ